MDRNEAIKLIDERMCFGRGKWSEHHVPEIDDYWKAGEMAIKALEQAPAIPVDWIEAEIKKLKAMDFDLATMTAGQIEAMLKIWREEQWAD